MKKTYDRLAAGDRIRQKRNLLGFTQDEMAEKIDRAAKYYFPAPESEGEG